MMTYDQLRRIVAGKIARTNGCAPDDAMKYFYDQTIQWLQKNMQDGEDYPSEYPGLVCTRFIVSDRDADIAREIYAYERNAGDEDDPDYVVVWYDIDDYSKIDADWV